MCVRERERAGLHPHLLGFLESWLADRVAEVVVGGHSSGQEPLIDSVYQGTVLGPPLWNVFYADARKQSSEQGSPSQCLQMISMHGKKSDRESKEQKHIWRKHKTIYMHGVPQTKLYLIHQKSRSTFCTGHSTMVMISNCWESHSTHNC